MATLIAAANGNLTTAGTWGVVDATSLLDSESANTVLTTSYVTSSTFTPGAITIDGIAVKLAVRVGTTGTISVALDLATVTVTGTEVTINVSDLPSAATGAAANEGGWHLFKFAAPVLLVGATVYGVKAKTSSATQVNLYSSATSNWSRLLRTTTTAAPGTGDILHIMKEWTAAATGTARTVTMDAIVTGLVDYGSGTDGTAALTISQGGTLTFITTSADCMLRLSGNLIVYNGGTLNMGTIATPMPSTSNGFLVFDPVADGGMGLIIRNGGTWIARGNPVTTVSTVLTADVAAAGTVLTVASTAGWAASELLGIASTTRTATQCELPGILTVDSATQVTLSAGLTYAHSGTSPTRAEVIYLGRNVWVYAVTAGLVCYVSIKPTAVVDVQYVKFQELGENAVDKRGIEIETTTGSCSMRFIALRNFEDGGIRITGAATNNITLEFVGYNLHSVAGTGAPLWVDATTGTAITIQNTTLIMCGPPAATYGVQLYDCGITINGLTSAGSTASLAIALLETDAVIGSFSNITAHSGSFLGLAISVAMQGTISNITAWRNNDSGISLRAQGIRIDFVTGVLFGNTTFNIEVQERVYATFKSYTINSDASYTTGRGISFLSTGGETVVFSDSSFGATVAHGTADIFWGTGIINRHIYLSNTVLASSTETSNVSLQRYNSWVRSNKHDQSGTSFKNWLRNGIIESDQTTRHTASGYSWKLTPNTAARKLLLRDIDETGPFKVAVNANVAVTVKVFVQKDGSYNGAAPRLVIRGGILTGIAADVVTSLTVGASTWEELIATATPTEAGVLEWLVDCDGSAGSIYVDDATVTQP